MPRSSTIPTRDLNPWVGFCYGMVRFTPQYLWRKFRDGIESLGSARR